jgi:hypothetical protein
MQVLDLHLPLAPDHTQSQVIVNALALRVPVTVEEASAPNFDPIRHNLERKTQTLMYAILEAQALEHAPDSDTHPTFACLNPGCDHRWTLRQASVALETALAWCHYGRGTAANPKHTLYSRTVFLACDKPSCRAEAHRLCEMAEAEYKANRQVMWYCGHCHKACEPKTISTCGRCKRQPYCSRDCQSAHWAEHKPKCIKKE